MPLIKSGSKKAMSDNISTEMHAGKPQKQSIAIAYAVKRRAAKRKKMAAGGLIDAHGETLPDATEEQIRKDRLADETSALASRRRTEDEDQWQQNDPELRKKFAEGGRVNDGEIPEVRGISEDEETDEQMLHGRSPPIRKVYDGHGLSQGEGKEGQQPSDGISGQDDVHVTKDIVAAIMHKRKLMAEGGRVEKSAGVSADILNAEDNWSDHGDEDNSAFREDLNDDRDNSDADHSLIGQILRDRKRSKR